MDWVGFKSRGAELAKKYRYVLLVLLAGLLLILLPECGQEQTSQEPAIQTEPQTDLQSSLEEILAQIQGAGKVKVLLTQKEGERTVYQADTDDTRRDTVILTASDRAQTGLVQQVNPPTYLGAVVVCQGADSASVRLAIVDAVASVTGLSSDKISVLKMK